ncbi:hypothetical protein AGRO_2340 [Agrobacterium sp. ATCC 31749]|nr:hypothetical protein AGRO_2340 [Agrobacterium sp. ATCC 31749]
MSVSAFYRLKVPVLPHAAADDEYGGNRQRIDRLRLRPRGQDGRDKKQSSEERFFSEHDNRDGWFNC